MTNELATIKEANFYFVQLVEKKRLFVDENIKHSARLVICQGSYVRAGCKASVDELKIFLATFTNNKQR